MRLTGLLSVFLGSSCAPLVLEQDLSLLSCLLGSLLEDLDQVLVLGSEGGEAGVSSSTLLGWGGTGGGAGVSRMTLLGRGGADPDGGAAGDDAGVSRRALLGRGGAGAVCGAAGGGAGVSR